MPHGVYLILVRSRRLLMLKRAEDDHPLFKGIWDFPGGIIEEGEDPVAAALREAREETGLQIGSTELLREWHPIWEGGESLRVTTFIGWEPEGDVRLSSEHSACSWMTPGEVLHQEYEGYQLRSPTFLSWMEGITEDMHLLMRRMNEYYTRATDAG
jgi:8-oxo-dGTP pyrophosphatase MutT (NUDIX family)